jgi:Receptor family ligand binding region
MRYSSLCFALAAATLSTTTLVASQLDTCGTGTSYNATSAQCTCDAESSHQGIVNASQIRLAGIFDTTTFTWGPDIVDATVQFINEGWRDALLHNETLIVDLRNSHCDETTAARAYWELRTENGNRPMDGIIGARCSDASITLARISGLEGVPQLSPASNSAKLSDREEFPYFSRLVAPNNQDGEGTEKVDAGVCIDPPFALFANIYDTTLH